MTRSARGLQKRIQILTYLSDSQWRTPDDIRKSLFTASKQNSFLLTMLSENLLEKKTEYIPDISASGNYKIQCPSYKISEEGRKFLTENNG